MAYEKLIFELSKPGRKSYALPEDSLKEMNLSDYIDSSFLREEELDFPEVSELDVVRHYTLLSKKNYSIDSGFYPLGSCTMKYNPKTSSASACGDGTGCAGSNVYRSGKYQRNFWYGCSYTPTCSRSPWGACGSYADQKIP